MAGASARRTPPCIGKTVPLRPVEEMAPKSKPEPEDDPYAYGRERWARRIVNGQTRRVLVGRVFTLRPLKDESYRLFKDRMEHFASELEKEPGTTVDDLDVQKQNGRPVLAEFNVTLPEARWPQPAQHTED